MQEILLILIAILVGVVMVVLAENNIHGPTQHPSRGQALPPVIMPMPIYPYLPYPHYDHGRYYGEGNSGCIVFFLIIVAAIGLYVLFG